MEGIVRHRYTWFAISLIIIIPGLVFLLLYGLRTGIDFAGGALWDVQFLERPASQLNTDAIARVFEQQGYSDVRVQLSETTVNGKTYPLAVVRTSVVRNPETEQPQMQQALQQQFGQVQFEQVQSVGATVSSEIDAQRCYCCAGGMRSYSDLSDTGLSQSTQPGALRCLRHSRHASRCVGGARRCRHFGRGHWSGN